MVKKGLLYFHQGWTDIINSLALINYYCKKYDKIYLMMRDDAKQLVDFYTKDLTNIEILYAPYDMLSFSYIINQYYFLMLERPDVLGIGGHDNNRTDEYKGVHDLNISNGLFFLESFYISYNIPYSTRIDDFTFTRNYNLEKITYQNFVNKYGNEYILYHEVINNYDKSKPIIDLNGISDTFFDMITVLENALEIHLLDSVWAAFIYQLDAKYRLFKHKKIYVYLNRGHSHMFINPILLDNWTFFVPPELKSVFNV